MSFSENLKKARIKAHLSQLDLAKKSGLSQQAISIIEKGERSPSESTMKLLAEALGYSVSDLMNDEKPQEVTGLTRDERMLIADYRNLNSQGQEYIRQQIYMALAIYKRHSDVSGVENEVNS